MARHRLSAGLLCALVLWAGTAGAQAPDLAPPSVWSAPPPGAASSLGPLDLLTAWRLAQARDASYAAAQSGRDAEQEKVPQARARLLPNLRATLGAVVDDQRRLRTLGQASTQDRGQWSLVLSQPVVDLAAWAELDRAGHQAALADIDQARAHQQLMLDIAQAYFDVLAAQDVLFVLDSQRTAVESQLQAAQRSFELGSATITDTHESQARLDLLRANLAQARHQLAYSVDRLAARIGERHERLLPLAAAAPLPQPQPAKLDDWTAQSRQASLDVVRAGLQAQSVQAQLDGARAGHYPTLRIEAQTGSASNRYLPTGSPAAGSRSLDSSVSLQLSLPLFSGGGISSTVREQASRLQQARHQEEQAKRQAELDARRYFTGVIDGLARVSALQAAEQSSLAAWEANRTGYEIGVRVNIDVLNAQQQWYETRRALALARYDTVLNGLRLKAVSGLLTEADIAAVNALLANTPGTGLVEREAQGQAPVQAGQAPLPAALPAP